MLLASLTTAHKLGLLVAAGAFIAFALICSLVIPRYRPDFPSKQGMKFFLLAAVALFIAMLLAIEIFGVEKPEAEAGTTGATVSTPAGTTTAPTTPAPSAADVAKGRGLYTSLGCIGCHSLDGSAGTGPTFKGLPGAQVSLTNGKHVVADDAYLSRSIADPDLEVVEGFTPGLMSAVIKKGAVSPADIEALVAFIQAQK